MSTPWLERRLRDVIGGKTATALETGLGLETVADLLAHYPRRYAERGQLTDLSDLVLGEHVTVMAKVQRVDHKAHAPKPRFTAVVGDGKKTLDLTWFGRGTWVRHQLEVGLTGMFSGTVGSFRQQLQLTHPEYVRIDSDSEDPLQNGVFAGALIPVYPASAKVASAVVARCVRLVLDDPGLREVADPLPADLVDRHGLAGFAETMELIHRPGSRADVTRAITRLKWDEALVLQVLLAQRRQATARTPATPRLPAAHGLLDALDAQLPYVLTAGQHHVGATLAEELATATPMHRLLQGEVGSGKTVVALRAMLQAVDAGGQCALLAPTEVLAAQHARALRGLLGPLGRAGELDSAPVATRVELLTGSVTGAARRRALAAAADGSAGVLVGTHALLSERVEFADLALVVVDEQHRFGVEQRAALRAKAPEGRAPHLLVMTATPIPRTVAMTVYGDLETSTLTELPVGRLPIESHVSKGDPRWQARVWQRVREAVGQGRQAFVLCARIGDEPMTTTTDRTPAPEPQGGGWPEESIELWGIEPPEDDLARPDRPPAAALLEVAPQLIKGELAGLRVGVLHGRLPAEEKDRVMTGFAAGQLDVLISTTVVEVGVDVPNATVMVILDAERFGISQLHQLRGRVGRGAHGGLCLLSTHSEPGSPTWERLSTVAATTDGAALARLDLTVRREGNVLGVSQSGGRSRVRFLELLHDEDLLLAARAEAAALVRTDPDLAGHPALAAAVGRALPEPDAAYLQKG